MPTEKNEAPVLKFRYKKNVQCYFGDLQPHPIPMKMEYAPNPVLGAGRPSNGLRPLQSSDDDLSILLPVFDMDFVHEITLLDERPQIPKKLPGASDEYHAKLADKAYERASAAKDRNDAIRARVHHYAKRGVIAIVSDPFSESEEEATPEAPKPRKKAA